MEVILSSSLVLRRVVTVIECEVLIRACKETPTRSLLKIRGFQLVGKGLEAESHLLLLLCAQRSQEVRLDAHSLVTHL